MKSVKNKVLVKLINNLLMPSSSVIEGLLFFNLSDRFEESTESETIHKIWSSIKNG